MHTDPPYVPSHTWPHTPLGQAKTVYDDREMDLYAQQSVPDGNTLAACMTRD